MTVISRTLEWHTIRSERSPSEGTEIQFIRDPVLLSVIVCQGIDVDNVMNLLDVFQVSRTYNCTQTLAVT